MEIIIKGESEMGVDLFILNGRQQKRCREFAKSLETREAITNAVIAKKSQ